MDEQKDRSAINPEKLNIFNTILGGIFLAFVVGLPAFVVWFWLDPSSASAFVEIVIELDPIPALDETTFNDSVGKTIEIKIDDSVGTFDTVTEK